MKKILAVLVMLTITCNYIVAQAQPQLQFSQRGPVAQEQLNNQFDACINNKNCSTRARLQIIQEENDEMNNRFQKIHQACADVNFENCVGSQKKNVDAWYAAQNKMQKLMQSMQARNMKEKEPAAGNSTFDGQ